MYFTIEDAKNQLQVLFQSPGDTWEAALFEDATLDQQVLVDPVTSIFTSNNHGLVNNCRIKFKSSGNFPQPLSPDVEYYTINTTTNTFQVGLESNIPINVFDSGIGTLYVKEQSPNHKDSIEIWLRFESAYWGSSRQALNFLGLEPEFNAENNWVQLPPVNAIWQPPDASITYRYFGIILNNQYLKIEDYELTKTIPQGFPLSFPYQAILFL